MPKKGKKSKKKEEVEIPPYPQCPCGRCEKDRKTTPRLYVIPNGHAPSCGECGNRSKRLTSCVPINPNSLLGWSGLQTTLRCDECLPDALKEYKVALLPRILLSGTQATFKTSGYDFYLEEISTDKSDETSVAAQE